MTYRPTFSVHGYPDVVITAGKAARYDRRQNLQVKHLLLSLNDIAKDVATQDSYSALNADIRLQGFGYSGFVGIARNTRLQDISGTNVTSLYSDYADILSDDPVASNDNTTARSDSTL